MDEARVTSGARVVIALFAATGAIALLVVAAFLLTASPAVRCVEGELQDNALAPDGSVRPRVETFATLDEAESFICRRIPHPRAPGDLMLDVVRVARERNLGDTIEGEGGASTEIEYRGEDGARLLLQVVFPHEDVAPHSQPTDEAITVRGRPAILRNTESGTLVRWTRGPFSYTAVGAPGFDRVMLLRILDSVR